VLNRVIGVAPDRVKSPGPRAKSGGSPFPLGMAGQGDSRSTRESSPLRTIVYTNPADDDLAVRDRPS
jgi:hypothetical protein